MSCEAAVTPDVIARAVDHVDDGIALVDRSGIIRFASSRMTSIFGYEPDDLVGQTVEVLVPPDTIDDHVAAREGFVHDGRSRPMTAPGYDIEGLRRDGTRVPVDVQLMPLTPELTLVAVRDATEARTKAAELALARADLTTSRRRESDARATLDAVVQHVFGATAHLDAVLHILPDTIAEDLGRCVAALHRALDTASGATDRAPWPGRLVCDPATD
jgi:PAS domain S-box-containing protein